MSQKPYAPIIKRSLLNAIRLERDSVKSFDEYPFCVAAIRHLHRLEFHPAVTFFVGENGSGKSTLLEAVAVKLGFNAEGGGGGLQFSTRDSTRHFMNACDSNVDLASLPIIFSSGQKAFTMWLLNWKKLKRNFRQKARFELMAANRCTLNPTARPFSHS